MPSSFYLKGRRNLMRRTGRLRNTLNHMEFVLWGIPLLLVLLASVLIASTQRQVDYADWSQHLIIAFLGICFANVLAQISIERIRPFLMFLYSLSIGSLVAVQLIGTTALGAQRWLSIAGLNVQPSEFAKLIVIIVLAAVLDGYQIRKPINLLKPLSVILLPWLLVFFQPDLGTSLVFGAVLLTMLYWSGMPFEWLLLVLSAIVTAVLAGLLPWVLFVWIPLMGVLAYRSLPKRNFAAAFTMILQAVIAWVTPWLWLYGLKDYQRDRLVLFLDPTKDPLGGGYHLLQSTVGIGSGQLFGTGLLQGQLTKLRFIPEQHTDFIFSALGEETGFLGTMLVITGFFFLLLRLLTVAREARTDFESLVVVGVLAMLVFQVMVNIFMTIGLGPVTGIPLPFMSYGRTALLVNFVALGLCMSVARRGYTASRSW
ncbi:rod shape-determining protein RodA [Prochlorococcus sp. MIT 1307]|uniref:rod shape-determining protein RodA n=1 Tax=Prochlorococcus sp. MIT 1307 TaxID=3096219 RepID=UPI0039BFDFAD